MAKEGEPQQRRRQQVAFASSSSNSDASFAVNDSPAFKMRIAALTSLSPT